MTSVEQTGREAARPVGPPGGPAPAATGPPCVPRSPGPGLSGLSVRRPKEPPKCASVEPLIVSRVVAGPAAPGFLARHASPARRHRRDPPGVPRQPPPARAHGRLRRASDAGGAGARRPDRPARQRARDPRRGRLTRPRRRGAARALRPRRGRARRRARGGGRRAAHERRGHGVARGRPDGAPAPRRLRDPHPQEDRGAPHPGAARLCRGALRQRDGLRDRPRGDRQDLPCGGRGRVDVHRRARGPHRAEPPRGGGGGSGWASCRAT